MQLTNFRKSYQLIICLLVGAALHAQGQTFTRQDSLRGSLNAERTWWDVLRYDISVTPDYNSKTIAGEVNLGFKVVSEAGPMQIDLQEPMNLTTATLNGKSISFTREGNAWHLAITDKLPLGSRQNIVLAFSGKPREAVRAPWDGGWIWTKDRGGNPWMTVACQGLGASVWYPCKDHQSDEPDNGASLRMTVDNDLAAVGNGRLLSKKDAGQGKTEFLWEVKNPINNYDIIPYIGKYSNWNDS